MLTKQETSAFVVSLLVLASMRSWVPLAVGFSALVFFVLKRKEVYFLWSLIAPRITGSKPILENLLELAREEGPGENKMNDVFRLDIPFMKPIFFVLKPSYVKRVLSLEADSFPSGGSVVLNKLAAGTGQNILLCEGPPSHHWAKYRAVTSKINKDRHGKDSMLAQMINTAWENLQKYVSHFDDRTDQPVDLFHELFHVMIPSHNRALFGNDSAKKFTYPGMHEEMFDVILEAGLQLNLITTSPKKEHKLVQEANKISDAVLKMAKDSTSPFMKDLLAAYNSGTITETELHSNLMVFEYAQAPLHVTFWLLYLLALHPEDEKLVVHEIANALAQGPLDHSRLGELKHLSKVVAETLRLYPGVGIMQARFPKINTMFGRHFVPAGSMVFLIPFVMQRNARYWPNPDDFDTSREDLDTSYNSEKLIQIPFGSGPRQCQGQYYAQDFIKVSVITLLQHYKISLAPGQQASVPTEVGFLRPSQPVYFQFTERTLPVVSKPMSITLSEVSSIMDENPILSPIMELPSLSSGKTLSPKQQRRTPPTSPVLRSRRFPVNKRIVFPNAKRRASASHLFLSSETKKRNVMLVAFGSQSGNARGLASSLVSMAELRGNHVTFLSLSELDPSTVQQYKLVVIATSTHGDGCPPTNAEAFGAWLEKDHPSDLWSEVEFAVLSLGSSLHAQPFKFGDFVSSRFEQLGAKRILADGRLDEAEYNQKEEFARWTRCLFATMKNGEKGNTKHEEYEFRSSRLLVAPFVLHLQDQYLDYEPRNTFPNNSIVGTVVTNRAANSDPRNLMHCTEIQCDQNSVKLEAGDHIAVLPANNAQLVQKLITRLGYKRNQVFEIQGNNASHLACSLGENLCTAELAFSYFYDITSPPSMTMLHFLAANCSSNDQKAVLSYSANYTAFLALGHSILDVLEMFPSVKLVTSNSTKTAENLAMFLGLLDSLRPRYYSVANCPGDSGIIRIVYKVVHKGNAKQGVCSNYLKDLVAGERVAFSPLQSTFKLPASIEQPIILVSAGSGISPFLGFLEQCNMQRSQGHELGRVTLIHGCRSKADFACNNLVDEALANGSITKVLPAYSLESGMHVQDVIEHETDALWTMLNDEKATMYVCGDGNMCASVHEALLKIASVHLCGSSLKPNHWLQRIISTRKLRHDEWGDQVQSKFNSSI